MAQRAPDQSQDDTAVLSPSPQNDVAAWWKSFTPEQREALLRIMTPEQKHRLRELIERAMPQNTNTVGVDGSDTQPHGNANSRGSEEEEAIRKLRMIAEAIMKCPDIDQSISEFSMLKGKDAGTFRRRVSAPLNVTWDVERRPTSIHPEIGFIEFTTKASCEPSVSLIAVNCKQKDALCWAAARSDSSTYSDESKYCQDLKPNQYRYEFDFGTEGLHYSRALMKAENADKSLWEAIDLEHGKDWTDGVAESCAADAVRSSAAARPPEIPETLWEPAKNGNVVSIRHIATLYDYGQGVPQNYGEAIRWYRLAANKGDDWSMGRLGALYDLGLGVSKNKTEALRWQRMAADRGNAVAMAAVGGAYYDGLEVPQSYEDAYFWLSLSGSVSLSSLVSGNNPEKLLPMLQQARDEAAAKLSSAKRSEVQERVEKWMQTHPNIH